jgi:hypothetical protein
MNKMFFHKSIFYFLILILSGGCSTLSGWDTQSASNSFIDGTVVLGEVITIATREETLNRGGYFQGWRDKLISAGYSDKDIVDGSEVSVWTYCFAHNSGVDWCSHTGHYVAHVPDELRKELKGDDQYPHGDLVEVKLGKTEKGYLVGEVVAVYREAENWNNCHIEKLQPSSALYSAVSTLMLVGPPQGAWIECEMDANQGWKRRPVSGAPLSAGQPVSEWVKYPK